MTKRKQPSPDRRPSRTAKFVLGRNHPDYEAARVWCYQTARLRNSVNYAARQLWFQNRGQRNSADQLDLETQRWLETQPRKHGRTAPKPWSYEWLWGLAHTTVNCRGYPHQKVAQQAVRELAGDWLAHVMTLIAIRDKGYQPAGSVRIPGYSEWYAKTTFNSQAVNRRKLRRGWACPTVFNTGFQLPDNVNPADVRAISILPRSDHFIMEVSYRVDLPVTTAPATIDEALRLGGAAGVDLGVNNLAAILCNQPGVLPVLVKGKTIKSWNQWANKRSAQINTQIAAIARDKTMNRKQRKRQIDSLERERQNVWTRRTRRIDHQLHTASRGIAQWCADNNIKLLVVGKNDGWKQGVHMGRRNNQNFVPIPHARFIQQLQYKTAAAAVLTMPNEESWTSKASFLDRDPIPVWPDRPATPFSGRRVRTKRYRSASGIELNADVNGAGNILRKVVPDSALADGGIGDAVVHPVALGLPRLLPQRKSRSLGREHRELCLI